MAPKQDRIQLLSIESDDIDQMALMRARKLFHIDLDITSISTLRELDDFFTSGKKADVIFCDYYLEYGNATDVIQKAKNIPVLVTNDTADNQVIVDILKVGAFDFIIKDIDRSYLSVLPFQVEKAVSKKISNDNERLLSSVVTHIRDSVVIVNNADEIIFVNPAFTGLYGYSKSEILGMPMNILVAPELRGVESNFKKAHFDQTHVRKDGSEVFVTVSVSTLNDEYDNPTYKICVSRDTSEREDLLRKVRKSQQRLSKIFDNSSVAISMFLLDGGIVEFNQMFRDFTKYEAHELNKMHIDDLLHSDDKLIDRAEYNSLLNDKISTYVTEKRLHQKDDNYMWVRMSMSVVKEDQFDPGYVIAIAEDITERKRIQEALTETEVRLDGIMSSIQDVVYSMNMHTREIYYVNKATQQIFGLSDTDFRVSYSSWRTMGHG
ncbi:MAG: PAS domain S-box protein [Balneolales bacterium]|nr:PAS domain S-box protein [Balneolales bacterium]